jgi:hypothetical protein
VRGICSPVCYLGIDQKKTAITGGFFRNSVLSFYERLPLFTAVGLE